MKRRRNQKSTRLHQRTATAARRSTQAPKASQAGSKPVTTSISRQKLLDVSRLDRKATLRARKFHQLKVPKLRDEAPKSPTAKAPGSKERLQKILAAAGVCSRRKAEELIILGQVTVNGEVANTLGTKCDPSVDIIAVDGKVLDLPAIEKRYFLLNKPRGYITSTSDPQGRPTVIDLMPGVKDRIYPVGRLDFASEGLLLLTNDGDTANLLMHPSSQIRRSYAVKVKGGITDHQLETLRDGVHLMDGFVKPLRVERGSRLTSGKEWVEIDLTEGKNLEIRRIFAVLDLEVDRLRRIAIGPLKIEAVPVGKFVELPKKSIDAIFQEAEKRTKPKA